MNGHIVTDSSAGPSSASSETSVVPPIECTASWLLPGNVVWAKTACHEWWPAEVAYRYSHQHSFDHHFYVSYIASTAQ